MAKFAVVSNIITGRDSIYSKHRTLKAAEKALEKARKSGACFKLVQLS